MDKISKEVSFDVTRYRKNGVLHREDGPAYISRDYCFWYKEGKIHREDGYAVISEKHNEYHYYLDDMHYSKEDYEEACVNKISDKILKIYSKI